MRKTIVVCAALMISIAGAASLTQEEAKNPWSDYAVSDIATRASNNTQPAHIVGRLQFPSLSAQDSFVSYVYSYGDIVVFSYADSNDCRVTDTGGNVIWSDNLMKDDYKLVTSLEPGVYMVAAQKGISVISGDPFVVGICCWYAVNENNSPLGTKLLSVGPKNFASSQNVIVVFAYEDETHVSIQDVKTKDIVWEGDLDSAEYYFQEQGYTVPIVFSVQASKPVSAGTFSGVVGTYAPAFNGTFTGTDFMTYCHEWTEANQDLQIIPWEDEITVTVTDLDNPEDTIWQVFCEKRGEIKGTYMPEKKALYIHSDKNISVSQTPWASFGDGSIAFYMARGIDSQGSGLGTEFYLPVEQSVDASYYSHLHVIAFFDSTEVKVTRIPSAGGTETDIWEGTLAKGEYYQYTCPSDASAHAIYHVTATERVATVVSCRDRQGSDFYPVLHVTAPGIADESKTPETANWQVISPLGAQVVLHYDNMPKGFNAMIFDASGRKVDELKSSGRSGTLTWPAAPHSNGVYFIVPGGETIAARKVILVR